MSDLTTPWEQCPQRAFMQCIMHWEKITPLYIPHSQSGETDCEDQTIVLAQKDID